MPVIRDRGALGSPLGSADSSMIGHSYPWCPFESTDPRRYHAVPIPARPIATAICPAI